MLEHELRPQVLEKIQRLPVAFQGGQPAAVPLETGRQPAGGFPAQSIGRRFPAGLKRRFIEAGGPPGFSLVQQYVPAIIKKMPRLTDSRGTSLPEN